MYNFNEPNNRTQKIESDQILIRYKFNTHAMKMTQSHTFDIYRL